MINKRLPPVNGEIYHIVIRAVEGSKLFRDKQDYLQIIHNLFEFNDEKPVSSKFRVLRCINKKMKLTRNEIVNFGSCEQEKREMLVQIFAFCLMPNHVHLLVRQIKDGGITKFMRKTGAGYANYYNQKYKRTGHLFQGRYRMVHVKNDKQLITVFVYIHTNPIAIIYPGWKEKGIANFKKAVDFIENYKWSSYSDYLENRNFPSVTAREWLTRELGGVREARRFVNDWLELKRELIDLKQVAIE